MSEDAAIHDERLDIPPFLRRAAPPEKIPAIPGLRGRGSPEPPAKAKRHASEAEGCSAVNSPILPSAVPLTDLARRINRAHEDAAGCFSESVRRA